MPSCSPSPGRKLQGGGVGGDSPAALGKPPQALPARGVSGVGGAYRPGFRVGAAHCLPPWPPPHGPQVEKVTPAAASGGLGGGGSESSRPMSLLRNLHPPHHHHHPGPWGKLSTGQAPEDESSADWAQMCPPTPDLRVCVGAVCRSHGTQASENCPGPLLQQLSLPLSLSPTQDR